MPRMSHIYNAKHLTSPQVSCVSIFYRIQIFITNTTQFILPHSHLQFASTRVEHVVKNTTLEYPVEMHICIVQQSEGSVKHIRCSTIKDSSF